MSDLRSNITIIKFFWRHASKYPVRLWAMIATVPLALLFNTFLPALIIANVLQRLASGDYTEGDILGSFGSDIAWVIGLATVGGTIIWRLNAYLNWTLEGKVIKSIQQEIFEHLIKLDATFHANHFGGSLVSQANKLAGAYVRVTDTTLFGLSTLLWSLVFTNILLWSKASLFVLLLDVFSIVYVAVAVRTTKNVRKASQAHADAENEQTGHLADAVTNVMAVKSFSAGASEGRHYRKANEHVRRTLLGVMSASLKSQTSFSIVSTIIQLVSLVTAVGSIVVYDASLAVVFLVFTYTMEMRTALWNFSTQALRNYNKAFGDAQAMADILKIEPAVKNPEHPEKSRITKGAIAISDMHFTHHQTEGEDGLFAGSTCKLLPVKKSAWSATQAQAKPRSQNYYCDLMILIRVRSRSTARTLQP